MRYCVTLMMAGLCCLTFSLNAQVLPEIVPPAPEAAALGKYLETPVSYSSGLPQISIPMAEARNRDLSVPVALSYHAGGIRVEEIASRVGLGWSLQAGGVISRTVQGLADDSSYGWLNKTYTLDDFKAAPDLDSSVSKYAMTKLVVAGELDFEPDLFNFSFPGGSGQFILDEDGQVVLITDSDVKITYSAAPTISGWTITDALGYTYYFGSYNGTSARDSTVYQHSYAEETTTGGLSTSTSTQDSHNSSWHLLAIHSPKNDAAITFSYTTHNTVSANRNSQVKTLGSQSGTDCSDPPFLSTSYTVSTHAEAVISSIDFGLGSIAFDYSGDEREDLEGDHALEEVRVKDAEGEVIRTFTLTHDYFVSDDASSLISPLSGVDEDRLTHRLYLSKVTETGKGTEEKVHTFTYHTDVTLPNRFSYAQDIWGYYNGADENTLLIPTHIADSERPTPDDEVLSVTPGADRRANAATMGALTLESITYPTGGISTFEFEANGVFLDNAGVDYETTHFGVAEDTLVNYIYETGDEESYETTFTIDETHVHGTTYFTYQVSGCAIDSTNTEGIPYCGLEVTLTNSDSTYTRSLSLQDGVYFNLSEGTYTLTVTVHSYTDISAGETYAPEEANAFLIAFTNSSPYADRYEYEVGGLRVMRITHDDGLDNSLTKAFAYYTKATGLSSGVETAQKKHFYEDGLPSCHIGGANIMLTAHSKFSGSGLGSGVAAYTEVHEFQTGSGALTTTPSEGDYDNGYTVYTFDWTLPEANDHSESYPYTPYKTMPWRRGNATGNTVYSLADDGTLDERFSETTEYTYSLLYYHVVQAMKVTQRTTTIYFSYYDIISGYVRPALQTTTTYEEGDTLTEETAYTYDSYLLRPSKVTITHPEGEVTVTETYYTYDADDITELSSAEKTIVEAMESENIRAVPLLTKTTADSGSTVIHKELTIYSDESGYYLPRTLKVWNTSEADYEERLRYTYDNNGNYRVLTKDDEEQAAYLWGYGGSLPVARVTDVSTTEGVAYTSFESDDTGNWSYSGTRSTGSGLPSGAYAYDLSTGDLIHTSLDASKTYKVSYWAKGGTPSVTHVTDSSEASPTTGSGWTYYEKTVSGSSSVTISGSASIDEVRLYPMEAAMTSYTYIPLYGVTTITGPDGMPVHYVYDDLGRLSQVLDKDGNILRQVRYAYGETVATGTTKIK